MHIYSTVNRPSQDRVFVVPASTRYLWPCGGEKVLYQKEQIVAQLGWLPADFPSDAVPWTSRAAHMPPTRSNFRYPLRDLLLYSQIPLSMLDEHR